MKGRKKRKKEKGNEQRQKEKKGDLYKFSAKKQLQTTTTKKKYLSTMPCMVNFKQHEQENVARDLTHLPEFQ